MIDSDLDVQGAWKTLRINFLDLQLKRKHPILRYPTLIFSLIALFWLFPFHCVHAQHPVGYGSIKSLSLVATFSFDSLDCKIVKEKSAAFYAEQPTAFTFEILVDADGSVKYVRAPRMKPEFSDVRLACTSALYSYAFEPVAAVRGQRWFKATMVLEGN